MYVPLQLANTDLSCPAYYKETPWPPNPTPTFSHPGIPRTRSMISSTWWNTTLTRHQEQVPPPSCQERTWTLTGDLSRTLPRIHVLPVRPDIGTSAAGRRRRRPCLPFCAPADGRSRSQRGRFAPPGLVAAALVKVGATMSWYSPRASRPTTRCSAPTTCLLRWRVRITARKPTSAGR